LRTYPLRSRASKVHLSDFARVSGPDDSVARFVQSLPRVLAGGEFRDLLAAMARARRAKKPIIWAMGAHVIKVGLNPVLIDLMANGWISVLALNGAGIVHDFELAYAGATSEDVEGQLKTGRFGMARETGERLNAAIGRAAEEGWGLGEAVGRMIAESSFPFKKWSLLGTAHRLGIPATVHVAVGTDVIHMHPRASGEAIGAASLRDFYLLAALVAKLNRGGVFLNVGSAVILPEVFLKAVSLARNLGRPVEGFTTAVFDFHRHYRPSQNVVLRPPGTKGKGYYFVGHHEIMIPLLAAALGR